MKKLITHSKSSLFLIEMILSILILALTCTVCVRIFAAAKTQREEARELNHIQELVTSAGETLEGWNGQLHHLSVYSDSPQKLPALCCNITMMTAGIPVQKIRLNIP